MAQIYRPAKRRQAPAKTSDPTPVVGLDHQGRGVVRTSQGTRFIDGALPGDMIRYQNDGKYTARLIQIMTPAEHRVEPPCSFYQQCGGCDLQHLELSQQRIHKQQVVHELLQKFAGTEPESWLPPHGGDAFGYRRRSRLAVHWNAKRQTLKLGFRAKQSKEIVAINDCMVLEPLLNKLLRPLQALLPQLTLLRWLGHVELYAASTPVVLLRLSDWQVTALNDDDRASLAAFASAQSVAIWFQLDTGESIPVVGEQALPRYLTAIETAAKRQQFELPYTPGDFIQANAASSEWMVQQALRWLDPQPTDTILELYAGTGNFSIPIAATGAKLVAVEGVGRMVQRLQENLNQALGQGHTGTAIQADLNQPVVTLPNEETRYSKALLDPARSGAQHAVALLAKLQIPRIIYVSCAPDTLARDAGYLHEQGYRIKLAQVVDMFPQTHHIETIVWFERES
ncbi:23S rRNA (uracil(1939)-C(5))-methyltransferase RlmD [Pseudidiomarina aestuarii]|uniref:23S rRNA (Uracil(1939)-C(5))-methyltransferase RlmD n=1 Tax=Pseudidiomarina aestuarii TaxID=624146 RepID=A0A7Z7ETM9_9GAMM|nr:23S rRNA (uracil(1939)-C(5))-methyltransferase RlmD [Pseudidiomarina aestuarii]RUO41185.1 23S rRNA (uracil(1939)-C(5))-methyltransferase RlmD [Pseudidiomarina aestuarii]